MFRWQHQLLLLLLLLHASVEGTPLLLGRAPSGGWHYLLLRAACAVHPVQSSPAMTVQNLSAVEQTCEIRTVLR
jgi:hypothetical protein